MGKEGPCHHCGVTSTPLWRNGPPEKPVLCNACGSRWRTKGTLVNYTPLHSRLSLEDAPNTPRVSIPNREAPIPTPKRMCSHYDTVPDVDTFTLFSKGFDEDVSNPSSSGSAVSVAESCAQFGPTDAVCDFAGALPSPVWDSTVPSRKRTCVGRLKPPSHFEKLTRDLYTIFHERSCFSVSSDDDLLLETDTPMLSVETGHGSILIRHPTTSSSLPPEEESESSSLSIEKRLNYPSNGFYGSRLPSPLSPLHTERLQPERHPTHESLDLPEIASLEGLEGHFIEKELQLSKLDDRELEP